MVAASLGLQFETAYKKVRVTPYGVEEMDALPLTKRYLMVVLRREPTTLAKLIAAVRNEYEEYKYVRMHIFIGALTELIEKGYVSFK